MSEQKVPDWAQSLPDDLKSHPAIANTPDVQTLAKRVVDLDSYKGRSIALPKEGDEQSRSAFAEAVMKRGFIPGQVPETPEGYDFGDDASSDEWVSSRREEYHRIGLTAEQAKRALQRETEIRSETMSKFSVFSDSDKKAAQRAVEAFGVDVEDPVSVFNLLKEVGSQMTTGEDSFRPGLGGAPAETPESIDLKIHEMNLKMKEIPSWDPRYQAMLNDKSSLLQRKVAMSGGQASAPKPLSEIFIGGKPRGY